MSTFVPGTRGRPARRGALLSLDLNHLARVRRARLDVEVAAQDPLWAGTALELRSPVRVALDVSAVAGGGVYAAGYLAARLGFACRRCLQEGTVEVREEVRLVFEPGDPEAEDSDAYVIDPGAGELDLSPAVREHFLLAVPLYPLCHPDCRGLCPRCGANLNEGPCRCPPRGEDPRWAPLRARPPG